MSRKGFETDRFETSEGALDITFIGHGTLMLDHEGTVVHLDPVSREADYSSLPKADVILITHAHVDHLDKAAIRQIRKRDTVLIGNPSSIEELGGGEALENGATREVRGISIQAIAAYNTSPERKVFHPKGRDNGYVLTIGGVRVYVAGDTELTPEMAELDGIDVALLPMNQPYTMSPEQVAEAAMAVQPKVLYPYHFGETQTDTLLDLLPAERGVEVRIRSMA